MSGVTKPPNDSRHTNPTVRKKKPPQEQLANKNDTFGDDERKIVQRFKEETARHQDGKVPVEVEVRCMLSLAEVYKSSAIGTLNYNNLLRTCGLLELCVGKSSEVCKKSGQIAQIPDYYEALMLKKMLKLKPAKIEQWQEERATLGDELEELQETRDIYCADFKHLIHCTTNLPDPESILDGDQLSSEQLCADDKIIASFSIMSSEAAARIIKLLSHFWEKSIRIAGCAPCKYALICNGNLACHAQSPFEPLSVRIVLEKDSPGLRNYFRNALTLFTMRIMEVRETNLSALKLRSLSFYKSQEEMPGFFLMDMVDDIDRADTDVAILDFMKTPAQLTAMASSASAVERGKVERFCFHTQLIAGDEHIYKELQTVRHKLMLREQSTKEFHHNILVEIRECIGAADPFSRIAMKDDEVTKLNGITDFPARFLHAIFKMEKSFTTEVMIRRLEELMTDTKSLSYPDLSICTGRTKARKGSVQLITSLCSETNEDKVATLRETKERRSLARLPTQNIIEANSGSPSPSSDDGIDDSQALKKLKHRKAPKRYSDYYRGYMMKNNGDTIGYTHPLQKPSLTDTNSPVADEPDERKRGKVKNPTSLPVAPTKLSSVRSQLHVEKTPVPPASQTPRFKTNGKAKPEIGHSKPTTPPQRITRLVEQVPLFNGKQQGVIRPDTGQDLIMLYCLSMIIKQGDAIPKSTDMSKYPHLNKRQKDVLYLRMMQIIIPLIDQLRPVVESNKSTVSLRKALQKLDLAPNDDELAVAILHFHNKQYDESSAAVYKYIENHSDITFCGEPFPVDLKEVCLELVEDRIISMERYESIHTLVAYCYMRRGHYADALYLWNNVKEITKGNLKAAEINDNIAQCCMKLKRAEEGLEAVGQSLKTYKLHAVTDPTLHKDVKRLEKLKLQLHQL